MPARIRPYTMDIGQINIPWHVILRFLISEGSAYFGKSKDDAQRAALANSRVFPVTRVKQPVQSLVTYEGVEYEMQAQMETDEKLAMQLRQVGAEELSKRGEIVVVASFVMTRPETRALSLEQRLAAIELFYIKSCKKYKDEHFHKDGNPKLMFKASQEYDRMTAAEDATYIKAMDRYRKIYDGAWTATRQKQLIVSSHDGSKTAYFSPDVPSMNRFHLPTWNNCNDRIPYAEWILQTVPENAMHLAKPTIGTEHFLGTLADMAFKRVDISPEQFVETVNNISLHASKISEGKLENYAKMGTSERVLLIKAVELTFYTVMMVAHATRYHNDGRMIKVFKRMVRVDVEAPQHDMMAGTSDAGDCEDEETPEIIIASLIQLGRTSGDKETGGRGWSHPVLKAMRTILQLYADFTIFGSVNGRQVSDGEKSKGLEDEEGLIRSVDDINEPIGGHTFLIMIALLELASRYEESKEIIDLIVNYSVSAKIEAHVLGLLRGWTGTTDKDLEATLFKIYRVCPAPSSKGRAAKNRCNFPLKPTLV